MVERTDTVRAGVDGAHGWRNIVEKRGHRLPFASHKVPGSLGGSRKSRLDNGTYQQMRRGRTGTPNMRSSEGMHHTTEYPDKRAAA